MDILEKWEELGGEVPLDSDDVVISSGGRISTNVRGGGHIASSLGESSCVGGPLVTRALMASIQQPRHKPNYHNTPLSLEVKAPSRTASLRSLAYPAYP